MSNKIPGCVSPRLFQTANELYMQEERQDGKFSDPVSREFVAAGQEKGRKGEYLAMKMFQEMGYKTEMLNGTSDYDLRVKIKGTWYKVEVKTAAQTGKSHRFTFSGVKTGYYDLLVTVFVGYDYTSVQISGKEGKRFIDVFGSDFTGANWEIRPPSKVIGFNKFRSHSKLRGIEAFFDMTKKNVERLV
jgi:hypothetical protein